MNLQDSTEQRLMESGTQLFAQKGFNAVSIRDIVKLAQVSNVGAVSYYFGGKKGLYLAILKNHFSRIRAWGQELLEDEGCAFDKMKRILSMVRNTYESNPYLTKLLLQEVQNPSQLFPNINGQIQDLQNILKHIIQEGIQRGEIDKEVDVNTVALMFYSIAHFGYLLPLFSTNVFNAEVKTFEHYHNHALHYLFNGIESDTHLT